MKVVIIGQGYVGLPLGMAAVRAGFNVLGIDIDSSKISIINERKSPVEDISAQVKRIGSGKLEVEEGKADAIYSILTI
jgi:UDP-N-acetyl-D-mannosaminuronate dehydrogenase